MVPHHVSVSQPSARIGVGIDTSRYGHYAAFLRDDLQPAAAELQFAESAAGYAQLRQRLEQIAERHGAVHFVIRLDAAGQYADNLLHFLHGLAAPVPDAATNPTANADRLADCAWTISNGDPQRNKNYRAALYGSKKSDPYEARACARYALTERPASVKPLSQELRILRQVAARLQAVVRQRTRLINQFHHLLALTFPELATLVNDIAAGWVLELVHRYPTAPRLAAATAAQVGAVPYLSDEQIEPLLTHARNSVASLQDAAVEELIREQIRQLRDSTARQKRLENLLVSAYFALPEPNYHDSIKGFGDVTAAVLTAFILDIERFDTPGKLVAYFGTLPIQAASGVDRDGNPRGPKRYVMSKRGNDLVRRYLWMAGMSAVRHNPAVRALYARVVVKNPKRKAIAIGHAMRKLLHLAFAVWKTKKPFDPKHYPWATPTDGDQESAARDQGSDGSDMPVSQNKQAARLKPDKPASKEVTAAGSITSTPAEKSAPFAPCGRGAGGEGNGFVDFAHLKRQLPIARVLDQLGLTPRLKGKGPQQRCTCPIHRGDARGRTFSVHLADNVFQCFAADCGKKGDVIDLWASVRGLSLRDAALDLVATFSLEPAPPNGTEKRNG